MRNVKIYSYNLGSAGCRLLSANLGIVRVRDSGPRLRPIRRLINWGSSGCPQRITDALGVGSVVLNPFNNVKIASNKLETFQKFAENPEIQIPQWTTDPEVARTFGTVVCRTVLRGHSGNGIVLWEGDGDLPRAPLYTQYVKKKHEFRVHVMNGEVIDVQQKRKRRDFDGEPNTKVRNHQNGWVYCRENLDIPDDLSRQAILATGALGLDFGAVDLIYNERQNRSYVLEVNTAPGLEGTTLENYVNGFKKHYLL